MRAITDCQPTACTGVSVSIHTGPDDPYGSLQLGILYDFILTNVYMHCYVHKESAQLPASTEQCQTTKGSML